MVVAVLVDSWENLRYTGFKVILPSVFGVPLFCVSPSDNRRWPRPRQRPVLFCKQRLTAGPRQDLIETRLVDLTKIIVALFQPG